MLLRSLLVLACVVWSGTASATAQIPDVLIDQGKEHALHSNPMEPYFKKYPERRPRSEIRSTALWRGYLAFFELRGEHLVLKDIKVQVVDDSKPSSYATQWSSALTTVVPDGRELKIDWFTGLLVLPKGSIQNYVHMGYGSRYTHYRLLEVHQGRIVKERNLTGQEYDVFKDTQFQAYRRTDAYKTQRAAMEKDGHSAEFIDSFLKSSVMEYTTRFLDDPPKK